MRTVVTSRKRRCEDAWGVAHDDAGAPWAVWVIDGATPLNAADPVVGNEQVAHFAWALSEGLEQALTEATWPSWQHGPRHGSEPDAHVVVAPDQTGETGEPGVAPDRTGPAGQTDQLHQTGQPDQAVRLNEAARPDQTGESERGGEPSRDREAGSTRSRGAEHEISDEAVFTLIERARAAAQRHVAEGFPGQPCPTATLSLVLRSGPELLAYVIGDSPLWIESAEASQDHVSAARPSTPANRGIVASDAVAGTGKDQPGIDQAVATSSDQRVGDRLIAVEDPQYAGNEERALSRWYQLRAEGHDAAAAYRRVLDGQATARALRNTPGGVWILGDSPQAVAHGVLVRFPARAPTRVAVLSDGLERSVRPFGLLDRAHLFEALHGGQALTVAQRLRAAETADPHRTRIPRLTTHDDITGVAATL